MSQLKTWSDAEKLSQNEQELRRVTRIRLIHLMLSQDNATAIRAIELLREMSSQTIEDDFSDIPSDILEKIRERATKFIRDESGNSENGRETNDD